MPPAGEPASNDETKGSDSGEDVEGHEKDADDQTKKEEEDKDSTAARELLLILLCNRSLAHLK